MTTTKAHPRSDSKARIPAATPQFLAFMAGGRAYLGISKVALCLPHQISHSGAVAHFSLVMVW